jgi:hypothetical protein
MLAWWVIIQRRPLWSLGFFEEVCPERQDCVNRGLVPVNVEPGRMTYGQ